MKIQIVLLATLVTMIGCSNGKKPSQACLLASCDVVNVNFNNKPDEGTKKTKEETK